MLSRTAKIIISIILSLTSVGLFCRFKGQKRKYCMIAMILCTIGDLFMVNAFGLGDVSTYPGAAFFMIGHVVYGLGFIKASKAQGYSVVNRGFKLGLAFVILTAAVLAFFAFTVPEVPQTVMFFLILIYVAVIGFNLVCQFSYASSEKSWRYMLALGMALFLISDFIIFLNMLDVTPAHNDLVWATYIPAQALIIIFSDKFKKGLGE